MAIANIDTAKAITPTGLKLIVSNDRGQAWTGRATGGLVPNAIAALRAALLIGVRLSNIAADVTSGSPSGASGQFLVRKIVHVTQHRNRCRRLHDAIVEIPLAPAS
jgi:hypothetical protein